MTGCGPCTLCCTLMKVAMEPPKPWRTPCPHCTKAGCSIYDDRPDPCRVFECFWLAMKLRPEIDVGIAASHPSLRPDQSHVVLELNSVGTIIAHCQYPAAWKREPMNTFLAHMATRTRVMIDAGDDKVIYFAPDGTLHPLEFVGVDPVTNERLYRVEIAE